MRGDDLHNLSVAVEVHIDGTTRYLSLYGQIHQPQISDCAIGEDAVAERSRVLQHRACDARQLHLIRQPQQGVLTVNFLKGYDIGLQLFQYVENPFATVPTIRPNASVYIIRGHDQLHDVYDDRPRSFGLELSR
jgi:hypothetical protein